MGLRRRIESFRHAFRGLVYMFSHEIHAKIHLIAVVVVVVAGVLCQISTNDWALIMLSVGLVLCAEAFNTSIERLADVVSPELDPRIRIAKDVAAGGVLVAAVMSIGVGVLVFLL